MSNSSLSPFDTDNGAPQQNQSGQYIKAQHPIKIAVIGGIAFLIVTLLCLGVVWYKATSFNVPRVAVSSSASASKDTTQDDETKHVGDVAMDTYVTNVKLLRGTTSIDGKPTAIVVMDVKNPGDETIRASRLVDVALYQNGKQLMPAAFAVEDKPSWYSSLSDAADLEKNAAVHIQQAFDLNSEYTPDDAFEVYIEPGTKNDVSDKGFKKTLSLENSVDTTPATFVYRAEYKDLEVGKTYRVTATMYERDENGNRKDVVKDKDGKPVVESVTFVPKEAQGGVNIPFANLDVSNMHVVVDVAFAKVGE